jgi:hypothetical protein
MANDRLFIVDPREKIFMMIAKGGSDWCNVATDEMWETFHGKCHEMTLDQTRFLVVNENSYLFDALGLYNDKDWVRIIKSPDTE